MDAPIIEIDIPTVTSDINTVQISSGTSDYSQLTNKPKINNVELNGNKTTSELGIVIPTKTSELTNDSGFLTEHQSLAAYSTTEQMDAAIAAYHDSSKQNALTAGTNITIVNDVISATGGGSTYTAGTGIEISNNEISIDEQVVAKTTDIPTKTSDLTNDSGFITNSYHDSSKQDKLVTDDNVVYPLYVDTGELRLGYGFGLHKVDNLLEVEAKTDGGILMDANGVYVDTSVIQPKLTAGSNITISNNTISATDTTYTAGTNITIDANNVISASSGEPSAYLKSASVSNKTLTLTNKDDSIVTFTDTGSVVSASASGSSTTEVGFITIDGTEYKLPSGGGSSISGIANGTGTNSLLFGTPKNSKKATAECAINATYTNTDGQSNATGRGAALFGFVYSATGGGATASGDGSFVSGFASNNTNTGPAIYASADGSHAEGYSTKDYGIYVASTGAHAEGYSASSNGITACGHGSYARGKAESSGTIKANGAASVAMGYSTGSSGQIYASNSTGNPGSFAGGYADNANLYSEGQGSIAYGYASSAIGYLLAKGKGASAFGWSTVAASDAQTAIGKCNERDDLGTYAFIIGNGTESTARHNALTVDWNGNLAIAGAITASNIPAPPSTDGNYVLKCTVTGGAATYSWVADT